MVEITFLPDDITVMAEPGESWLRVAERAGIDIPTGCQMGSCGACTVDIEELGEIRTCISAVPANIMACRVYLFADPTW
ncbi:2Fe-2S iron-sulfur cluster binding domain-containing protein [Candidatus Synechococcus calcipolaris G9]|uniref:2Fe-2S iron-sulfur cluster binding domain-containing protein n=1 Tax=Candidatus Synechococcus calcipolaris G9 TaxID=1497997 RepID=A0ABT6EZX8_9SYNE|nr:2Fe-2S iron-sulfur cluster binding domain-containing protein [Candidatus Synechococcus calcipolaris]MDG2991133.1 2Fe-2S iron-sulfur cluster binding domain-containing protein [Candidatus Synechococcus calcipolaris G9]